MPKYDEKIEAVWSKAAACSCASSECPSQHKLCPLCTGIMRYEAHESNEAQKTSMYSWSLDYLDIPENLQACHIECLKEKS